MPTIMYPRMTRTSFSDPRSPPPLPQYAYPTLEKYEHQNYQTSGSLSWVKDDVRNHAVNMIWEFMGTFMFLFLSLTAVQIANSKDDILLRDQSTTALSLLQISYISFAFGASLAVNVWLFSRVSGGMFNPAVTLGLCLAGVIPLIKSLSFIAIQLMAGILASLVVSVLFTGAFNIQTTLGSGTSVIQGLFIEMIMTSMLVFAILMMAVEKHRATSLAPLGIGLALFMIHLIGINFTGSSVNPARTFGPAVVLVEFNTYHWIYWAGPAMGALLAVAAYKLLKLLHYQTANPGQDYDGLDFYRVVQPTYSNYTPRRRASNDSNKTFTSLSPFKGSERI